LHDDSNSHRVNEQKSPNNANRLAPLFLFTVDLKVTFPFFIALAIKVILNGHANSMLAGGMVTIV
jgi:hypothetical protein